MNKLHLTEPKIEDESAFLNMAQASRDFHQPWVYAPLTSTDFKAYIERYQQPNQKSYLVCNSENAILGVFNISEIVRGGFQSAYLGFYVTKNHAGTGVMNQGLKLLLTRAFTELKLHRIEANIQPQNKASIQLVNKNGFKKEGFSPRYLKINDIWRDHERWALTIEDWQN